MVVRASVVAALMLVTSVSAGASSETATPVEAQVKIHKFRYQYAEEPLADWRLGYLLTDDLLGETFSHETPCALDSGSLPERVTWTLLSLDGVARPYSFDRVGPCQEGNGR